MIGKMTGHEVEKCPDLNHGWFFMPMKELEFFYIGNGEYSVIFRREVTC